MLDHPYRISRSSAPAVTDPAVAPPGRLVLRDPPAGLPEPTLRPPVVAESGDPFTALRVIDLLARVERGVPVRIADIASRLEASDLDWHFPVPVVADVALQLQANWMADYRNVSGIVLEDGPYGPTIAIEDSARVDPWIVGQARRAEAECRELLVEFSRRDHPAGDG